MYFYRYKGRADRRLEQVLCKPYKFFHLRRFPLILMIEDLSVHLKLECGDVENGQFLFLNAFVHCKIGKIGDPPVFPHHLYDELCVADL